MRVLAYAIFVQNVQLAIFGRRGSEKVPLPRINHQQPLWA